MKGEALITIKDKNGKIKQQVKENNLVFDIPKELMKEYLRNIDFGESEMSAHFTSKCSFINRFDNWFGAIFLNDELCSEQDFKDWKMPVIYGGETAVANANRTRYALYTAANSTKVGNIMKKSYTWNNCPAFTLRSINLKHIMNAGSSFGITYSPQGTYNIKRCKNLYYKDLYGTQEGTQTTKGIAPNIVYKKSTFSWGLGNGRRSVEKVTKISNYDNTSNGSYNSPYMSICGIVALKNDELAIFKTNSDITVNETSGNANYLIILDANDGTVKRTFALSQFSGSSGSIVKTYPRIVATSFGSFLVMSKTNNTTSLFVWKIPEQSEMENYSNNETIEVYADLSSYTQLASNQLTILNEYIIYAPNTLSNEKTIRINNDAQNPITVYDYAPVNGYNTTGITISKYYDCISGNIINYSYGYGAGVEAWYNTTVLNLSEGVAVAEGDTVTIEYTITAN